VRCVRAASGAWRTHYRVPHASNQAAGDRGALGGIEAEIKQDPATPTSLVGGIEADLCHFPRLSSQAATADDPCLYDIVRLPHDFASSPSLRRILQPDVIRKLAL
jgi:hypothetical protein